MLKFEKYKDEFKELYPDYPDEKLKEIFELTVNFRQWLIENFDTFFDIK